MVTLITDKLDGMDRVNRNVNSSYVMNAMNFPSHSQDSAELIPTKLKYFEQKEYSVKRNFFVSFSVYFLAIFCVHIFRFFSW